MTDREKVIKGWECHMEADTLGCADCPYRQGWRTCNFADTLFKDVYTLLKEQPEIVRCKDCKYATMTIDGKMCKICAIDTDDFGDPQIVYHDADWFCADGERR